MLERQIGDLVAPSATMRYWPNKLHGDELVIPNVGSYVKTNDEWLDREEIAAILKEQPAIRFVMVDRSEPMPVVYEFKTSGAAGWARIDSRYISDDGYPPSGLDAYFIAHLWSTEDGDKLVVFEVEC
jgi:hypothetical protein